MNIPALKAFAPAVRRQLIEAVTLQLNHVLTARTPDYLDTYASQVRALRELAQADRPGLIERVAYTWFNRLTALRFLDARGWHPFGARVLTPATPEETQPELLKLVRSGHCPEELQRHTSLDRLNGLLDGRIPSNDAQGEVYRHLVLAACRFYNALLPDLFERLDDETELLLPDDLLTEHSVAQGFRSEITDEDCAEVEMLGWLYQFYISEKKDQVMARKATVPTADIPAVTQLFTPHWIVRYLVENSLGRLWLLNRPDSLLRSWMPYYIEREPETDFLRIARPEDIRICDPAVGSGHMLTYAFDLLFVIYEEEGYAPSEIPALILRNNLHGLDICPRAAQLAEMALIFKAREKSSQFFQPGNLVPPRVIALRDVHFAENELRGYIEALRLGDLFNAPMIGLLHQFEDATTFGSLIQPCLDEKQIGFARGFIEKKELGSHLFLHDTHKKIRVVLEQAEMLAQRYHIVVANPPYMGGSAMNGVLKDFARASYGDSKSDMFAMFIERSFSLTLSGGLSALVTMQSWMFLSSFEQLRATLIGSKSIRTLIQIGYNSFPEMNSKIAQACAFVVSNALQSSPGIFFNLNDAQQAADKEVVFLERIKSNRSFRASAEGFRKIPGSPIAYWVSDKMRDIYARADLLGDHVQTAIGLNTGDNSRFLRVWSEVSVKNIDFHCPRISDCVLRGQKWFPYNKGGSFRKWYGNRDFIINWEEDGREVKDYAVERNGGKHWSRYIQNLPFMFRSGVTWTFISSSSFAVRTLDSGCLFDVAGSGGFSDTVDPRVVLAFLCSSVAFEYLKAMNPTLNFQARNLSSLTCQQTSSAADFPSGSDSYRFVPEGESADGHASRICPLRLNG